MFLKVIVLFSLICALCGCKQVYLVSNNLSQKYMSNRDYLDIKYSTLKVDDILFYVRTGYFKKELKQLIVFLNYDALSLNKTVLKRSELILKNTIISEVGNIISNAEKQEVVGENSYIRGGSRLAFDILNIKDLLDQPLVLRVYFQNDKNIENSIDIEIIIVSDRIWIT